MRQDDLVKNVISVYLDGTNKWSESRKRAEICYKFMLNEQWNKEETENFLAQGMPPIVYNLILPRLFNLLGTEQLNRSSIQIRPYYKEQTELAGILTGLFNNLWESENGEEELQRAFIDGLIMPIPGCIQIRVEPDEAGFMDYKFRALNPYSVIFDPYSSRYDLKDCQYVIMESWLRLDELIDTYGNKEEFRLEGYDKKWWEKLSETLSSTMRDLFGVSNLQSQFYDKDRNLYKVLEMQTRTKEKRDLFINTITQEYVVYPKNSIEDPASMNLMYVSETEIKKIHLTTVCPYFNLVLVDENNWLDTDRYDIIPYYSMDFGNQKSQNSSLVWAMIDPQKNLNKREIQKTAYIDRAMISPVMFSYEDRDTKEDFDINGRNPHYTMLVRNYRFPPTRLAPSPMPYDVWNDIADVKDKMNDISGINEAARGQSEYSNESARLYQMKVQRLAATINPYYRNLSKTRRMIAEYFLDTCRQVYSELNRVVTIMDMQKNTSNAILNQVDGESIRNQISTFIGRVVLDEGKHSPTQTQENFEKKLVLAQMLPRELINWEWLLKDSELPDVQEQIDYIKQMLTQMAQQQEVQNQMAIEQFAQQQAQAEAEMANKIQNKEKKQ